MKLTQSAGNDNAPFAPSRVDANGIKAPHPVVAAQLTTSDAVHTDIDYALMQPANAHALLASLQRLRAKDFEKATEASEVMASAAVALELNEPWLATGGTRQKLEAAIAARETLVAGMNKYNYPGVPSVAPAPKIVPTAKHTFAGSTSRGSVSDRFVGEADVEKYMDAFMLRELALLNRVATQADSIKPRFSPVPSQLDTLTRTVAQILGVNARKRKKAPTYTEATLTDWGPAVSSAPVVGVTAKTKMEENQAAITALVAGFPPQLKAAWARAIKTVAIGNDIEHPDYEFAASGAGIMTIVMPGRERIRIQKPENIRQVLEIMLVIEEMSRTRDPVDLSAAYQMLSELAGA